MLNRLHVMGYKCLFPAGRPRAVLQVRTGVCSPRFRDLPDSVG